MTNQTAGRNHEYTHANLTSVVVAETTSQLLRESSLANRELSRIRRETTSFDAYAAAEAKSRDAISKFYGFLIRFAAARLSSESELLERAAYCSARVKRSHDRIEASRPEWFVIASFYEDECWCQGLVVKIGDCKPMNAQSLQASKPKVAVSSWGTILASVACVGVGLGFLNGD